MCYVGSSVNIGGRRRGHIRWAKGGAQTVFHRAIREFGEDSFDFEVLEECGKNVMLERERFYIAFLNAASIDGFNTRSDPVASYDRTVSAATRQRISAHSRGRKLSDEAKALIGAANSKHRRTPEQKARMSQIRMGMPNSPEARAKISAFHKGKKKSADHRAKLSAAKTGVPQSAETSAKISASLMGRKFSKETRALQRRVAMENFQKRSEAGLPIRNVSKWFVVLDAQENFITASHDMHELAPLFGVSYGSIRNYVEGNTKPASGNIFLYAFAIWH